MVWRLILRRLTARRRSWQGVPSLHRQLPRPRCARFDRSARAVLRAGRPASQRGPRTPSRRSRWSAWGRSVMSCHSRGVPLNGVRSADADASDRQSPQRRAIPWVRKWPTGACHNLCTTGPPGRGRGAQSTLRTAEQETAELRQPERNSRGNNNAEQRNRNSRRGAAEPAQRNRGRVPQSIRTRALPTRCAAAARRPPWTGGPPASALPAGAHTPRPPPVRVRCPAGP